MTSPISPAERCYAWSRAACFTGTCLATLSLVFAAYIGPLSVGGVIGGAIMAGAGLISSAILATALSLPTRN